MNINPLYLGIAIGFGATVLIEVAFMIFIVAVLQSKSK